MFKKFLSVFLAFSLFGFSFGAIGCARRSSEETSDTFSESSSGSASETSSPSVSVQENWTPETIKDKPTTGNDFLIGSWVSYARSSAKKSAVDQTALLSDGGINFLIYASCVPSYGMLKEGESARLRNLSSADWWQRIDDLMKHNNIVYMFSSDAGLGGNDTENRAGWQDNAGQSGVDNAKNIVPSLDNCIGYHLADEPAYSSLPGLAGVGKKYAQIKDGLTAFWNAHPGTSTAAIGGDYEAYFKAYLDNVGRGNAQWISHDFYPFTGNIDSVPVSSPMFYDMSVMRKICLEYDVKAHAFVQSCSWRNGTWIMPNIQQIKWNVNAYMAYGFKAISYFNYVMWGYEDCIDGIIDINGNMKHRALYDDLAKYNFELRALAANINLSALECAAVYHTRASIRGTQKLPDNWLVSPSGRQNLILSYLRPKDDSSPYLILMNNSFNDTVENQNFSISEGSGIDALEIYDFSTGNFRPVEIRDGNFTLSFDKSESKYLRITGNVNTNIV